MTAKPLSAAERFCKNRYKQRKNNKLTEYIAKFYLGQTAEKPAFALFFCVKIRQKPNDIVILHKSNLLDLCVLLQGLKLHFQNKKSVELY